MRINRAADDAAGLTISERLRAQVRGLARASQNAQEAINLLQTAEGAANETTSILQRIRELAVQAANGTLTQNDRGEIQKEVDQLIDEVNRIARTTQFNSKNLLNGQAAALTSVDNPERTALIVTGDVGKGGNFNVITTIISAPQLAVWKSDHMHTIAGEDRVGIVNGEYTFQNNAALVAGGNSTIGVNELEIQSLSVGGRMIVSGGNFTLSVLGTSVAVGTDGLVSVFNAKEITAGTDRLRVQGFDVNGVVVDAYLLISAGTTFASVGLWLENAFYSLPGTDGNVDMGADTGRLFFSQAAGVSIVLSSFVFEDIDNSGSTFNLSVAGFTLTGAAVQSVGDTMIHSASIALTANGVRVAVDDGSIHGIVNTVGTAGTSGTIDVRFDGDITIGSDDYTLNVAGQNELQEYGTVTQVSAPAGDYTFRVSALSNRTYRVTNLDTGSISSTISIAQVGTATNLNLDTFQGLTLAFDAILVTGETGVIHVSTNNVLPAQNTTTLASIAAFQENGVFLGRASVELKLNVPGQSRAASIYLNAGDTIEDMVGKISLAIANPNSFADLNLEGAMVGGSFPDLVHYNLTGPAQGTISITSPVPGSELIFSGDESLLNAMSLIQIQETAQAEYNVSITDIETGALVAQTTTNTGIIRGILNGIELWIDTTQGFKLDPDGSNNYVNAPYNMDPYQNPIISLTTDYEGETFVHVVPNPLVFQIGANQGQKIQVAIGQLDAKRLGIEGLLVVSTELAEEAITKVDTAVNVVTSQRSQLGSIQNRLESTIRNLDIAFENLSAAESGIRDLNVAQQMIELTREQILLQAGTAVLAQANQLPQTVLQLLR
jgi:flagellin